MAMVEVEVEGKIELVSLSADFAVFSLVGIGRED